MKLYIVVLVLAVCLINEGATKPPWIPGKHKRDTAKDVSKVPPEVTCPNHKKCDEESKADYSWALWKDVMDNEAWCGKTEKGYAMGPDGKKEACGKKGYCTEVGLYCPQNCKEDYPESVKRVYCDYKN